MSAAATAAAIERSRLIAILRSESADEGLRAAAALVAGGVEALEFSLASPAALAALQMAVAELGSVASLGAGTVLTSDAARAAVEAGAEFLVSPNVDPSVGAAALELDVLHLPGALTPTEVAAALTGGAPLVKLFPAVRLGPGYVRDLLAPFPDLKLVPTGGIDAGNAAAFLSAGAAAVAVGGALTAGDAAPAAVTRRARDLVTSIQAVRRTT
ncbi:MAG: bifunctional 4-hydroxy-2-oxoglutarate aldolase/2-dehydro-3-deoxy-phosphogluconate aldolase [Actinobacteria bacterium]|nr:bifunctional 4-hydroxy-2-oxoglutarate aldolase/2-dehydro-3-deoxy-phosphogluconate aldolase [Actinomycetota bacterium]